ncbi:hypothetical protein SSBR45G_22400 [Bradyrhizobium sp. SSBR45G]|uniref:hypothetical protein n=1 Tax=unclassified Bradyrhizobium TaxID=2631580 RepID=UPI002342B99C|nr:MULTISPECIES: hypothetical protein [unclassified Bradyrhizobium]GLH77332.1 hypothetical protein SSBR45G_22400 [Bradyrhizobium sp. SSBR45G]GLH84562.1 hypothetical protein SSBR45R_20220 [Bradyrhizobium sp. SSBR45R]
MASRRYLIIVGLIGFMLVSAFASGVSLLSSDGWTLHGGLLQIPRQGDSGWYRDFGGRNIPQIQDQDIFYSNLGGSIEAARNADIVLLGPSFVNYALDRQTLETSPALDRLKIYNMAFVGLRGGEFSRQVIKRWTIRPRLWVINADDQFVHFFSKDLNVTLGPQKQPVEAVTRSRLRGYLTVVGRNLRWRIEDVLAAYQNGRFSSTGLYRSISNGDMGLDANPDYLALGNKPMVSARSPDCHTNPAVVDYARTFIDEVGGAVVLTLVPHSQSCVQQAAELAKALNLELITPPFDGLTTVDGGGHLDRQGAQRFTSYLAREIVNTAAFKRAFPSAPGQGR